MRWENGNDASSAPAAPLGAPRRPPGAVGGRPRRQWPRVAAGGARRPPGGGRAAVDGGGRFPTWGRRNQCTDVRAAPTNGRAAPLRLLDVGPSALYPWRGPAFCPRQPPAGRATPPRHSGKTPTTPSETPFSSRGARPRLPLGNKWLSSSFAYALARSMYISHTAHSLTR